MALIYIDEMFVGESAEIVSISNVFPEYRQLRDIGLREGRLIDLLQFDPLITRKLVLNIDGMRIALDAVCAAHIRVRPLKNAFVQMRDMACRDKLTGCLNRHAADQVVRQEVERFNGMGLPLTLLMADLDHFKSINDTYGHVRGDEVLKGFADIVSKGLRRSDIFCRWGGEEFLILLRGAFLDEAVDIANRIRENTAGALFSFLPLSEHVTVSIGCAAMPPCRLFSKLVSEADAALYRAKREGRNRVCAH